MVLIPLSVEKCVLPCWYGAMPSHLTSCTPTKYNLYLDSSLETVIREPTLYKLLIFHVPNIMSIFLRLGRSKESVQVLGSRNIFVTCLYFTVRGC
jgi:hypothetical protein